MSSTAGQLLRRLSSFSLTSNTENESASSPNAGTPNVVRDTPMASTLTAVSTPSIGSSLPSISPDTFQSSFSERGQSIQPTNSDPDGVVITPLLHPLLPPHQQGSKQTTPTFHALLFPPRTNSFQQLEETIRRNSSVGSSLGDGIVRHNSFALLSSPVHESVHEYEMSRRGSMASLVQHDPNYSSLSSKSTFQSKILFVFFAMLAVAFRFVSLTTVTTESSAWITMSIKGKTIELEKTMIQQGYFPDIMSELYQAGGFASLSITLFGTLLTPFLRIAIVIVCYFYPLHERYHESRTQILFTLDHVGRFILVDIFAIGYAGIFTYKNYSLLPYLFHNVLQDQERNSPQAVDPLVSSPSPFPMVVEDINLLLSTELYVTFYAGLVSNVIGTFLTHHLLLKSIPRSPLSDKDKRGEKQILFTRLDPTNNLREHLLVLTTFIAVLCFGHLLIARAPIIAFQATGFSAQFPVPQEQVTFDIWTIFFKLPHCIYYDPDRKGLAFYGAVLLAFVYLTVVITIPLLVCVWALTLIIVPLRKEIQFELLFASPFWFSWCSVDLFFVVTLSEYFELDAITRFMASDMYPLLCKNVEQVFHEPCAGVKSSFREGIYSLGLLCLMIIFIRLQFLNLYHKMNENETRERMPVIL
jgi:hypothetical protein